MWDTKDDQLIAEKSVIKPYIIYAFQSDLNISWAESATSGF